MMTPEVRVALPKLFLWSEAARIQEYPQAAARAEPGRIYSRLEVERDLFDIAATMTFKGGAPRGKGTDGIINTYGLSRSGARYRIDGINLFERVATGLCLTPEGVALGTAFRRGQATPGTDLDWARVLARQVLRREPRTRLVVGLCLAGWQLGVGAAGGIPTGTLSLTSPQGQTLDVTLCGCEGFNALLRDHAELALGPDWRAALRALGESGPVTWEGVQGGVPSTNNLPTALKKSLAVLFHVGAFAGGPALWGLDAAGLAAALALDHLGPVGFEGAAPVRPSDDDAFAQALRDCTDADGFSIVSRLSLRFGELLKVPAPDRAAALDGYLRAAVYDERVRVLDRHPGQPRMGRGLFGESNARRIRLELTPIHENTAMQTAGQSTAVPSSPLQGEES